MVLRTAWLGPLGAVKELDRPSWLIELAKRRVESSPADSELWIRMMQHPSDLT